MRHLNFSFLFKQTIAVVEVEKIWPLEPVGCHDQHKNDDVCSLESLKLSCHNWRFGVLLYNLAQRVFESWKFMGKVSLTENEQRETQEGNLSYN